MGLLSHRNVLLHVTAGKLMFLPDMDALQGC